MEAPSIPDDLYDKIEKDIRMVQALKASGGDVTVLKQFADPPSTVVFFMITLFLGALVWILCEFANWRDIHKHWSHYRCEPSIMPFARFYGYSLEDTMSFCVGEAVKEHAPGVINPIYKGINTVMNTVDGVYDKAVAVEQGVAGLLSGFETFLVQFANSFRLIGTRIRMSLVRIRDIFERVYGMFTAFAFAGISAITFGENLICNPIVTFIGTIAGVDICCFAPDTAIRMNDGSTRRICDIRIGDRLAGDSVVTSTYLFDGAQTAMVQIHGIHVSGNHSLYSNGSAVRADEYPLAISAPSLDHLWCLGTSDNHIPVVGSTGDQLDFTDYEESSDPVVIEAAQKAACMALNGFENPEDTVSDYSLGLDPTVFILLETGYVRLSAIEIGDALVGGTVMGLVRERCEHCVNAPVGIMSAAQLVYHEGQWIRAAHLFPTLEGGYDLLHIFSSTNKSLHIAKHTSFMRVRDYMEAHVVGVQEPYDAFLDGR